MYKFPGINCLVLPLFVLVLLALIVSEEYSAHTAPRFGTLSQEHGAVGSATNATTAALDGCSCVDGPSIHVVLSGDPATQEGLELLVAAAETYAVAFPAVTFAAGPRSEWRWPAALQRLALADLFDTSRLSATQDVEMMRNNWRGHKWYLQAKGRRWFQAQPRIVTGLAHAFATSDPGTLWFFVCDADTLVYPTRLRALARQVAEEYDPEKERIRVGAAPYVQGEGFKTGAGILISRANMRAVNWARVLKAQADMRWNNQLLAPADARLDYIFTSAKVGGRETLVNTLGLHQFYMVSDPEQHKEVKEDWYRKCPVSLHPITNASWLRHKYDEVPVSAMSDSCIPVPKCCL